MVSDDFWEIEKLLPKKKYSYNSRDITTSSVEDGNISQRGAYIKSLLTKNDLASECEHVSDYTHAAKSSVIIKASVVKQNDKYIYSDSLADEAKKYSLMSASKSAEYTPFFSFLPEYKALNERQKAWYLYWRENIRNSVFLSTDFSYIYLFSYELFNTSTYENASENLDILISVWKNYHSKYPQLTKHMYDWILDFCIIYDLAIPFERFDDIIPYVKLECDSILKSMYIFDFILCRERPLNSINGPFVIGALSKYDYRKSKYYTDGDFAKSLSKAQIEIMSYLLRSCEPDGGYYKDKLSLLPSFEVTPVKLMRPAFQGAVISYKLKYNLIIEYYPYVKDELLSGAISETVKYIENKTRAAHKIKARISTHITNERVKGIIDRYFEKKNVKAIPEQVQRATRPLDIDLKTAMNIDKSSWQTTKRLTDYMQEEAFEPEIKNEPAPISSYLSENSYLQLMKSLSELELKTVYAAMKGESIDSEIRKSGTFIENIMDSINEKAIELTGDIIFDMESAAIIDCYTDDISDALKKLC